MEIYNQNLVRIDEREVDRSKGRLTVQTILVAHHDAIPPVAEVSHVEVREEGGKLYRQKVVDIPAVEAKDAWDEYKNVLVYKLYTEEELNRKRIIMLKRELTKVKEDIEQEVFGLVRDDYEEKKERAAEIINELRELEGKKPRVVAKKVQEG